MGDLVSSSVRELSLGVLWVVLEITLVRYETREDRRARLSEPEEDGWDFW
jgi:hypothetical protein